MPTELICAPTYLFPTRDFRLDRCRLISGVEVARLDGRLRETLTLLEEKLSVRHPFSPSHVVVINKAAYLAALRKRLGADARRLEGKDDYLLDASAVVQQALVTLVLGARVGFRYGGLFAVEVSGRGSRKEYRTSSYSHTRYMEMASHMAIAVAGLTPRAARSRELGLLARQLDRYYRSGVWWSDRLALALGSFWHGLCTPFQEQSFLSLSTALESLVSTTRSEITHILAERCALIVGLTSGRRAEVFADVKRLYNVRSKLVHGAAHARRGVQTTESLYLTAKGSSVPQSEMTALVTLTVSLILGVLRNRQLIGEIQQTRNAETTDKAIDAFFAARLLR